MVTRYFGGTKLGVGGLGRAYHDAAVLVLEQTRRVERVPVQQLTAVVDYTYVTPVMSLVSRAEAFIDATEYGEKVTFSILAPVASSALLELQLTDLTNGTASIVRGRLAIRSV